MIRRFPSKTVFIEEYTGRRMRRFQNSKTVITYNNYEFFTADYGVTLEGELTSPFQRSLACSRLAASPSRAGHEPTPWDQGVIPPWIPRRSVPSDRPLGISSDRQVSIREEKK